LQFRIVKFLFDRSFTIRSLGGMLVTWINKLIERRLLNSFGAIFYVRSPMCFE